MKKDLIITQNDALENAQTNNEVNRLDTCLLAKLQELVANNEMEELGFSRAKVAKIIKTHGVKVNGKFIFKASSRIKIGDVLEIDTKQLADSMGFSKAEKNYTLAELIAKNESFAHLSIVYENEDFLIINKPPNIVVHEASSLHEPTLMDWLALKSFASDLKEVRYGLVHRIDRYTSGALTIAKNLKTLQKLSSKLKTRAMGRYYIAIISSRLKDKTLIEGAIGRNPKNRLKMKLLSKNASSLESANPVPISSTSKDFKDRAFLESSSHPRTSSHQRYSKSIFMPLLDSLDSRFQLIAIKLFTGRMHQIRAHLDSIHHHILGDELYGARDKIAHRVMLHAYLLHIDNMLIKAPLFADMQDILNRYFNKDMLEKVLQTSYLLDIFRSWGEPN